MKKRFTKFMALLMTGVLCMSTAVFAANTEPNTYTDPQAAKGSASSEAQMEGWVDKDIFKVVLPTVAVNNDTFGFIIDPQGLIAATSGEAYASEFDVSKVIGPGLFFKNYDASANALSNSSDSMTALNKGTTPVKVSVSAKVTGLSKIGLSESTAALTSADAKKSNIYLAIAASGDGVTSANAEKAITATGGKADYDLAGASADAYEIKYVSGNASGDPYTYELTPDAASADANSDLFESVSFYLTGACNVSDDVDWSAAKTEKPAVEVAWTLTKGGSYASASSLSATSKSVTLTMPDGVRLTDIWVCRADGNRTKLYGTKYATLSGTTLTIPGLSASDSGSTVELTYSDGHVDIISVE